MKVAITVWGNRISPVFDSAQTVLLAEVQGQQIVNKQLEVMPGLKPVSSALKIVDLHPESLICGAISQEPARIIEEAGITLVSFISGRTDLILQAFIEGKKINKYCMPGCSRMCHSHQYDPLARNKEAGKTEQGRKSQKWR